MLHKELKSLEKFKIEKEPNSLFYKETNRYDGAINSYKTEDEKEKDILKPVYFGEEYEVIKVES